MLLLIVGLTLYLLSRSVPKPAPDPETVTYTRIVHLAEQCDRFRRMTKAWPPGAYALVNMAKFDTNLLFDAWGHPLVLIPPTNAQTCLCVISYGADGVPGGTGTNRDLCLERP